MPVVGPVEQFHLSADKEGGDIGASARQFYALLLKTYGIGDPAFCATVGPEQMAGVESDACPIIN